MINPCLAIIYLLFYPIVVWNMYQAKKDRIALESSTSTKQTQEEEAKKKGEYDEIEVGKLLLLPRFFFGLSA